MRPRVWSAFRPHNEIPGGIGGVWVMWGWGSGAVSPELISPPPEAYCTVPTVDMGSARIREAFVASDTT